MSVVTITGGTVEGLSKLETAVNGHTHLRGRRTGIGLSKRYELTYVPGLDYGIPSANADVLSATEATNITANRHFEILGTNATTDDCLINAECGITLTTSGADGDQCILVPHIDANMTAWDDVTWGTDQETEWEAHIRTGVITTSVVWAGLKLTNTSVTGTDANQVFFRYEDDVVSGDWQAIYSIGGSDTATDTDISVVTLTEYYLKITIDDARLARMYINDELVVTSTALTDGVNLKPYIGVEEDGASSAVSLDIYGMAISRHAGA